MVSTTPCTTQAPSILMFMKLAFICPENSISDRLLPAYKKKNYPHLQLYFVWSCVKPATMQASRSHFWVNGYCTLHFKYQTEFTSNFDFCVCFFVFRLDYSGIALLIMGSFVPWLYYSFYCSPQPRLIYLSVVCVLGISAIIVAQWDRFATPRHRPTRAGNALTQYTLNTYITAVCTHNRNTKEIAKKVEMFF